MGICVFINVRQLNVQERFVQTFQLTWSINSQPSTLPTRLGKISREYTRSRHQIEYICKHYTILSTFIHSRIRLLNPSFKLYYLILFSPFLSVSVFLLCFFLLCSSLLPFSLIFFTPSISYSLLSLLPFLSIPFWSFLSLVSFFICFFFHLFLFFFRFFYTLRVFFGGGRVVLIVSFSLVHLCLFRF